MAKHTYYDGTTILMFLTLAAVTALSLWPAAGHGQIPADSAEWEGFAQLGALAEMGAFAELQANAEPNAPAEPNRVARLETADEPDAVAESPGVAEPPAVAGSEPVVDAAEVPELDAGPEPAGWTRYEILLRRNIFSRQRVPYQPRTERREPVVTVARDPETYFVLKGIVQEGDAFIAFIEDTQGSQVLMRHAGDGIARGTIKSLTLDSMEYQREDQTTTIELGCDLKGSYGVVGSNDLSILSTLPSSTRSTGSPGQTTPTSVPSGDEAEILRRLMEQRKQQLGQ